jgi:hypothetical protein
MLIAEDNAVIRGIVKRIITESCEIVAESADRRAAVT